MISKTEVSSCPHVNLRVAIVCVNQFCLLNRYLGVALETLSFFFLAPSQVLELLDKIYICNMVLKIISFNIANVKCSCYVIVYIIICLHIRPITKNIKYEDRDLLSNGPCNR